MTKIKNNLDQMLKQLNQLNQHIDPPQLNTLEANVWQQIKNRTASSVNTITLFWRTATLSLVLFTGGLVGANVTTSDETLVVFSSTPTYSVMALLGD